MFHRKITTRSRKIADALDDLEKRMDKQRRYSNFVRANCPLRKLLHRIKVEPDSRSRYIAETPTDFLACCDKFTRQRQDLRRNLKKEKIQVSTNSATKLLDEPRTFPHLGRYIEVTGQFRHLKTYTKSPD
ncbi:hypothetical protein CROQUDRAFT_95629 [Cronartium quercuum f. sp. fusiforme G11]|uniref:Uncharacterized protein n=1 Tax=Cronartium quercuum f. sp. fusiforme G11 TaxID=708437 RepID=A0A9P6NC37_9BASI|nr:hypothetical protein CROQUDRAFT_95629 [Cronartium quercuum f. sp. fusiforme G11]